jgi:hypothetical protein
VSSETISLSRLDNAERAQVVAALRRVDAGEATNTREQRYAEQYAYSLGLIRHDSTQERRVLTETGRLWLAAVDVFGEDIAEIQCAT